MLLTSAAGFYAGARGVVDPVLLLHTLLGTALVAGGTNALNQLRERDIDALMERTRRRPLPSGRVSPRAAGWFAGAISIVGVAYLALAVNLLTAGLAALTLVSYVFLYTPLKRRTTLNTLIGAVPGALPIVGGWTAAGGSLDVAVGALFWILFLWQLPHFLALAWMYREDYARGGFPMLPVEDPDGGSTGRQVVLQTLALVVVTLLPIGLRMAGEAYLPAALLLGAGFLACGISFAVERSRARASRLFLASIAYLPLLLGALVLF